MSPISQPPRLSHQELFCVCRDFYQLEGRFKGLPSEQDQNALLETEQGETWVVKVANARADLAFCHGQQLLLEHLAERLPWTPRLRLTQEGERFRMVESLEGSRHHLQVLSYLPGRPLAKVPFRDPELGRHLGSVVGQMREALRGFDHPSLHRDFEWELSSGVRTVENHLEKVKADDLRSAMETCLSHFQSEVEPHLGSLDRGIIHGDLNDYNLLVGEGENLSQRHRRVSGIIDFGDTVHSLVVADLAVAAAYAVLDESNPLATVANLVRGYCEATSLEEKEIQALFGLLRLRLCLSAAVAAHQRRQHPENEYLGISQAPIARTLPRLAAIHPRVAEAVFREAAGLEPVRNSAPLRRWIEARQGTFGPVLEGELGRVKVLDLSIGSPLLHGSSLENSEKRLSPRLFGLLEEAGAEVGVGRYDEVRYFYSSDVFGDSTNPLSPRRVVHLGLDLFAPAGRKVLAPRAGRVFAFGRNESPLDYGPLIILEHEADGQPFWTLYGHLSLDSLEGLEEGQLIAEGEAFAALGEATVNGGWPPHLHFQVIVDHLEKGLDFPGVALAHERRVWTSFSPDPRILLGLDKTLFPNPEPTLEATQQDRNQRIGSSVSLSYRRPVKVVRGYMQYLFDHEGRRYLDAYNNVPHVGHCHPHIQKALRDQMAVLNTNTRYLHDGLQSYARELTQHLPESLDTCFFVNSGSEANELALRLARTYTGRKNIIVLEAAYHGHTTTLIDISPYKNEGPGGEGSPPWVRVAPLPDLYRGVFRGDSPESRANYVEAVDRLLQSLHDQGEAPSAFICESFPSVGGQVPLPKGYLKGVYRSVRAAGGLCIADEVQTGFGRIGTHFWAFDSQEVVPDVVVLGKPMGNGHPLGAVITTREIAQAFNNGMEFFSTFGGNTVSCAVGRAVLRVVEEERLQEHALEVGEMLLEGLRPLVHESPWVGDVRGSGLFLGVELVKDPESRVPAPEEASYIVNRLRQEGILLGTDGPKHNVIKIRPPMPFSLDDADLLLAALRRVLEELA